ncbi:MAG: flagellar hook-associated protein FlgK [Lachnospiraceae bacterium]|nr:flagellar hook-associated protein FlgK [Lachnospiraceae bacterium]
MGLMSDLYIGKSGLTVSQYGINISSHNLANVETKGFVRQQVVMMDATYLDLGMNAISKLQSGLGTNIETVRQVRNVFLDKAYRQELGRECFYSTQQEAINEMEGIFGELQGVAFQDSLEDFWTSLQELAKEPDSIVTRASLVETAVSFVERAENIYNQIKNYQVDLNIKIEEQVNRINEIADGIRDLNKQICFYESNGVENANDLRDQRNALLDELGEYVKISYKEGEDGQVSVIAEGVPLVADQLTFHMGTRTQVEIITEQLFKELGDMDAAELEAKKICENSTMLVPVWPAYEDKEVFNFDEVPNAEQNTDIGSLKGLILARGSKVARAIDIPVKPLEEDFKDEDGNLDEDAYEVAMAQYDAAARTYNSLIEPSVIMTVQAQFDQLVHGVVTTLNNILCPNTDYTFGQNVTVTLEDGTTRTYAAGDTIQILDEENAPLGMDINKTVGTELFSRKSVERYEIATLPDGTQIRIYNEENVGDNYSLYTLGEIQVNQTVLADKSTIPLSSNKGTGDFDIKTAEALITAWGEPFATLSPNTLTYDDFQDYYTAFIGEIANRGQTLGKIAEDQENMVASIDNQRLSEHAVSSDEELTNLIRFQHSYNAAARYINVVDEMLEHIVTRL